MTGPPEDSRLRVLDLYHERSGHGRPLVLLHGAFGTIESCFAELRPRLEQRFEVIAVELEGHGRTANPARPLSYPQMARDLAALITRLGLGPVHVVGYSMGGAVGMELALTRPDVVDRLVQFGGVSFSPAGDQPDYRQDGAAETDPGPMEPARGAEECGSATDALLAFLEGSRWHRAYVDIGADPAEWPRLVAKVSALDVAFGWLPAQVASLSRPTLLINGDADVTTLEHVVEMFRHLGGGAPGNPTAPSPHQLAILPGTTHEGMLDRVDWLETLIIGFLQAPDHCDSQALLARP